jgi:hypothetical protein
LGAAAGDQQQRDRQNAYSMVHGDSINSIGLADTWPVYCTMYYQFPHFVKRAHLAGRRREPLHRYDFAFELSREEILGISLQDLVG